MRIRFVQKIIDILRNKKSNKTKELINFQFFNEEFYCKAKQISEMRNDIEDLYLGLSYGQYGINPSKLDTFSFNLCCPSVDLYTAYKMYSYFSDYLPKLKNVFVVCSFYSCGFNLNKSGEKARCDIYEIFFGAKASSNDYNKFLFNDFKFLETIQTDEYYRGYKKPVSFFLSDYSLEERVKGHLKNFDKYGKEELKWLGKMNRLTKINNHNLIVLMLPFSDRYNNEIKLQSGNTLTEYNSVMLEYCKANNIDLINLSEFKLSDNMYGDMDHLNIDGANYISAELNKLLQNMA